MKSVTSVVKAALTIKLQWICRQIIGDSGTGISALVNLDSADGDKVGLEYQITISKLEPTWVQGPRCYHNTIIYNYYQKYIISFYQPKANSKANYENK